MEMSMERDSSALGSLFQQIINDMKNTSPLWEDFVAKASKLHACLRAAIQAIAAYLDAFQKIADAATNSRGASKEIGTALTRVCLRHKAVETRLKTFTAAIMDCLVQPLQDKLEDWKRSVATIDKEHAKEYKRCRTELKKRSTDTLRLQKKARKGQSDTLQSLMDSHMQDVTLRRAELEEVEKKSLRSAMIEERMRYCSFVHMLQPVVKEECEVMSELGHLQEAMQSIALVTKEPQVLPAASEELIHDAKASILLYPESPSASAGGGGSLSQGGCSNSLGSRKSSVCSISSMNSSGSSNSPGHPHYPRSLSQLISPSIRLKPGESSDSGFCSSPALTTQASSINNPSHAVTTWPTHSQDTVDLPSNASERPHTISSAYEKGHQRPPLTVYTFQNPETIHEGCGNNIALTGGSSSGQNTPSTQKSPAGALTRPPLPVRCSSLERPLTANSNRGGNGTNLMQRQCPSPIPAHVTKDSSGNVVENDERSRASVLQKASMFEKQAAAVKSTPIPPANASVGLTRNLENNSNSGIYGTRSSNNQQQQQQPPQSQSIDPQEVDKCFEDSLQELNNLIGELDSFQREIDASKQQKEHQKNVKNLYDGIDSYISNETMTIITDDNTTTIICETTQQQDLQQSQQEKDFCTASNQTNSSGCGTDISDTTSEDCNADTRSLTSQTGLGGGIVGGGGGGVVGRLEIDVGNGNELIGGLLKTNLKALSGGAFNSDSELSRCYISETSSIMGGCSGDGYENPTFAHFAASSSASQCYDDNRSDTLSLQRQPLYGDNISDNGSNVVVIYDHQPPITPDIDYCKQNSEIVMLRTKPAQHSQYPQEMRELQQLPDNLTEASSPTSPNGTSDHSIHQHIATVAPAKQRLSSFRASSEQLQLLNSSPTAAATTKAATLASSTTTFTSSNSSSTSSPSATTPLNNSCNTSSSCNSETIIHKKLPPKPPSLTVFQTNQHTEVNNNNNNSNKNSKLLQNSPKLDFKSDLEAKILKQKEKLKKQQENEKQQQQTQLTTLQSCSGTTSTTQQQQQLQQNHHNSNNSINCNSSSIINKINSLENSSLSCTPSSSSSSLASHSNNHNHSNTNHIPSSSSNNNHELPLKHILNSQHLNSHIYSKTNLTAHAYKTSTTTNISSSPSIVSSSSLSSSSSPPALRNSVMSSASLNVICTPPLPPPLPLTNTITIHSSSNRNDAGGSMLCNNNHNNDHNNHTTIPAPSLLLANVAKPSITPRPASLSGSTRIARRSSVNTAKPPPPVRRSSSVTPSPNTPTTPTNTNATNMLHQQAHSLNTSTENLPPPPAYLLEARQTTPTTPPSAMPNSSQKVSETVKALSGLRHQPASPHTLRRLQQQQQQQQHHQQHQSMLQPPKQYQHQYTKSSPVLMSPQTPTSTTKRTTTPTPPTPLSPQNAVTALHQMDFDDIPPPLPPPNPNHHHHPQLSLPLRYQQQLPTPNSNNNHMPSSQQMQKQHQQQHNHHHNQQQQQYHEQLQQLDYNNGEALYGTNSPTSFRTSSPGGGIYAQPKILNNMSSFRTNSPGPNGHQTPTTSSTTTQSHVPAQPKTNPNLIAQLNARLNSSKQQNTNEAIYGVTTVNHQQQQHHQREEIYMRNYQQQQQQQQHQQQQMSTHTSQPPQQLQQQQTYDAAHQQHPSHQQQQSQKVANVATNNAQQMRQSSSHQTLPMSQMSPMPPSTEQATAAHQQQSHYQIGSHHHHQQQLQQQQHTAQHYTCPPPLEDPPPPPIHNANNNSATMPKRGSSSHHHHHNHNQQQSVNLATYAAASSASTLPKNMIQQQRILQQQQQQHQGIYGTATHQAQQQQYHAPAAISAGHQHAQQYQNPQHISQRPPMPLPHHQQQQPQQQQPHPQHQQQSSSTTGNRHKTATINATKQPPVPSRHSSVQQKIFVATNPFIQTTTIHCHSPNSSSVHSQPASPVCNSPTPSSVASIYGTSSRRSSGSGSSVVAPGGMSHYDVSGGGNNAGAVYYNHQLNTAPNTNYTSTNVDKTTSIRSKAKAEFLENLNAKLAKQSLSGRAFAVRNLINSKALPDPRICHESLMDQIKRGATLKRNQKINDRSAPKIY